MARRAEEYGERTNGLALNAGDKVHRVTTSPKIIEAAKKLIVGHVAKDLKERIKKMEVISELSNSLFAASQETMRTNKDIATKLTELRKAQQVARPLNKKPERQQATSIPPSLESLVTLNPGLSVLSPPWDMHWNIPNDQTQFVQGFTDTEQSMQVFCNRSNDSRTGFGAAGFGLFLSSPVDRVAVSIRPFMPCDFGYGFESFLYSSNSRGGYGALIYDGSGNIVPGTLTQPEVWDRTSFNDNNTHIDGNSYIQAFLDKGEILLDMKAGETYQLWLWIWGHGDQSGIVFEDIFGNVYGSFCDFQLTSSLPFIVVL